MSALSPNTRSLDSPDDVCTEKYTKGTIEWRNAMGVLRPHGLEVDYKK